MDNIERERLQQLVRCVPDVFDYKSLLYIGANPSRMQFLSEISKHKYKIVILEIWEPNARSMEKIGFKVILGDIRLIDKIMETIIFDVVMWWHGPEHISKFEAGYVLGLLQRHAKHLVIAGSPWGIYLQEEVSGNPYERHHCQFYEGDYKHIGWNSDAIGKRDIKGSNLIGWKRT